MNSNLLLILLFILLLFIVCQYLNVRERFVDFSNDPLLSSLDTMKQQATNIDFQETNPGDNIEKALSDNLIEQSRVENDSFNKYQESQDTRITNLVNKLSDLEKRYKHPNKPQAQIRSIKSNNNGMKMSVIPLADNRHMVKMNSGCLSCDSVGNYKVVHCDINNPEQHFELHEIYNQNSYNVNLEPGVPKINNNDNNKNIKYPFNLVKSVTNGNCVQNNNNNLSVQPCNAKTSQRWLGLEENKLCI